MSASWLGQPEQPLYDVPSPTQINGTGTSVDLVPVIYGDGDNVQITQAVNTLYTTPSFSAGEYFCTVSLFYFKDTYETVDWSTNENYWFEVVHSSSPTISVCDFTITPYYTAYKDGLNNNSYLSMTGVVGCSGSGTFLVYLNVLNRSSGKSARVNCISLQKITPVIQ